MRIRQGQAWKVVSLTPVSELTDRQTVTVHRIVPYELRNDIHLLDKAQNEAFRVRVEGNFNRLRENKWLKTTGYRIHMTPPVFQIGLQSTKHGWCKIGFKAFRRGPQQEAK